MTLCQVSLSLSNHHLTLLRPVLDTDGSELFKKCGSDAPPKVTSSGSKLTVRFRSDSSVVRRGFKATWRKVAAAGTEGGTIKSENFPSNYPDNKDQVNIYTTRIHQIIDMYNQPVHSFEYCVHNYIKLLFFLILI